MVCSSIERKYSSLDKFFKEKRITIIYGARRTGKTTLVKRYLSSIDDETILETTGENLSIQALFLKQEITSLLEWTDGYSLLFIDEAQNIKNVGICLKMLIDSRPELKIIITGSASLDLTNMVGEPLVGRQTPLEIFPISVEELKSHYNNFELKNNLDDFLIYGMYPEVRTAKSNKDKKFILDELVDSTLLKDILKIENVKNPLILLQLLRLLAFQIGSEVNKNELSKTLGVDNKTVSRYLYLLEKSFIIYNLRGFHKNMRREVTKNGKYYFYDIGIRNSIIKNYNPLDLRNDVGYLWENFIVIERLKFKTYNNIRVNDYFWRTWEQNEIDLIEESDSLNAFEFKYNNSKVTAPPSFKNVYPESTFSVITKENFLNFIS